MTNKAAEAPAALRWPAMVRAEPGVPPVMLAPMAGITDLPFRRLVARFGAALTVSEIVASGEFLTGRPLARMRAGLGLDAEGEAVQIAGRAPEPMAECARQLVAEGARQIDINMGCPAKKVTGGLSGAALMRDLDLARAIIAAVVAAADPVPVTVKCRLGWDEDLTAPALARIAEAEGARMIVVHARSRCQFYRGRADWRAVRAVVAATALPVVVNGDIDSPEAARRALAASGAAGVMVGRAMQGRPWLAARIGDALAGRPPRPGPTGRAFGEMAAGHYEDMLAHYGRALGLRVARKHVGWYLDEVGAPADLRRALLTADDPGQVLRALAALERPGPGRERAAA